MKVVALAGGVGGAKMEANCFSLPTPKASPALDLRATRRSR